MPDKNKIKLMLGAGALVVAFGCVLASFLLSSQKADKKASELAELESQMLNLIQEKSQADLSQEEGARLKRESVSAMDILTKAKKIYGEQELKRKEGVLWLDRKSQKCVVTLGEVNGVRIGDQLEIYDAQQNLGAVQVTSVYDIVSFGRLVEKTMEDFSKNYYRVVVVPPHSLKE